MKVRSLRGGALAGCLLGLAVAPAAAQANTFPVTTDAASGPNSLAAAINSANVSPDTDTISFNLPGGQRVLSVAAPGLPDITAPVVLDATTQPGYVGVPLVQLVGCAPLSSPCLPDASAGANTAGLTLRSGAAGSRVSGLSIVRFNQGGIVVEAASSTISANYVGVDLDGVGPGVGNSKGGVVVRASGVTVGGTTAAERNVIGDNHELCGVDVQSGTASLVRGNYIGTEANGNLGLGNGPPPAPGETPSCGVRVEGAATQTVIGGSGGARNVIAGNNVNGIEILAGTDTAVQGNSIGLTANGDVLANVGSGVLVSGGDRTVIGGTSIAARNLLSGNFAGAGVRVTGGDVAVQGNYIGVGADGVTPRSNNDGVVVTGGTVAIGGTAAGAGNLITGNAATGITLGSGSLGVTVLGNRIGGDVSGGALAHNGGAQVRVTGSAAGNQIGSLAAGGANTIVDASGTGPIVLDGAGPGNAVRGNLVQLSGPTFRTAIDRGAAGITAAGTPQLTAVYTSGTRTQVLGTLAGLPNTTYVLDLYTDAACDSTLHRGIDGSFGSGTVSTDGTGQGIISVPVAAAPPNGATRLLATVTDPLGSTSELGTCAQAPESAPTLELSAADYSARESERVVHLTVTRTGGGPGSAGIRVVTHDGTARAPADYTAVDFYATVNADQDSTVVDIPVKDDGLRAGDRIFSVDLSQPNAAVQGERSHATVTVVDDTPAPPVIKPPVVSPAKVTISSPRRTARRHALKRITGRSTTTKAAKVRRIDVAVTRIAKCERLSTSGRLLRAKASLRKTCPPNWLKARGTTSWKYQLKRTLPAGTYRIAVRATDVNGNVGKVHSAKVRLR